MGGSLGPGAIQETDTEPVWSGLCSRVQRWGAEALREGAVTGGDRKREGACRDNIGRVLFPRG